MHVNYKCPSKQFYTLVYKVIKTIQTDDNYTDIERKKMKNLDTDT